MDNAAFRSEFPEFGDAAAYPDAQLDFWASVAEALTSMCAWGDFRTTGVKLYVAHEITIAKQSASAAASGGTPGIFGGVPNSKAVGAVNVGYDSTSTAEKDAGWWNLTNYGKQYIRLARMFGAGCIQL